jgi:hypothetical protein
MDEGRSWKRSLTSFASSALSAGHFAQTSPEPAEGVLPIAELENYQEARKNIHLRIHQPTGEPICLKL